MKQNDFESICAILSSIRKQRYKDHEGARILSLDWDAWTGDLYNGKCCGFCDSGTRPRPVGRGSISRAREVYDFWKDPVAAFNPKIGNPSLLVVSECHADLGYFVSQCDSVINIDYHTDRDDFQILCCGSWACGLQKYEHFDDLYAAEYNINEYEFYPDVVFMCLSSPWTSRATDVKFFEYVGHISSKCKTHAPVFCGHRSSNLQRRYRRLLNG